VLIPNMWFFLFSCPVFGAFGECCASQETLTSKCSRVESPTRYLGLPIFFCPTSLATHSVRNSKRYTTGTVGMIPKSGPYSGHNPCLGHGLSSGPSECVHPLNFQRTHRKSKKNSSSPSLICKSTKHDFKQPMTATNIILMSPRSALTKG
jgi:hypothetical protein